MVEKSRFNFNEFKGLSLATDLTIFTVREDGLNLLLLKSKDKDAKGGYVIPGGFVGINETPDGAVSRVLKDKTGLKPDYVEQLYTFGEPSRDTRGRVVSLGYLILVSPNQVRLTTSDQYLGIGWFPIRKLPKLAYDYPNIVGKAIRRIKNKLAYSTLASYLLPEDFTFKEIQSLYESVLGHSLDKRNFRRKINALGLLKATGRKRRGPFRPAALYEFKEKKYKELDVFLK